MASTVTSVRLRLGNSIREARLAAKMTQEDVAALLDCTQGKINKIETGVVSVKQADLDIMLAAFKIGPAEAQRLREMADSSDQRGNWSGYRSLVPTWFRSFTELEPTASEILGWHGERIPGSLQSEHYMLTQFTEAEVTDITGLVRNRRDRKRVFNLKNPPSQRFILGEAAFLRMPGGPNPGVALDQVQYLLELMSTYPRAAIHVLPFSARLAYVPNDFTIMRFTDGTANCVFVEHVAGMSKISDEAQFQQFVDAGDQLRGSALEKKDTIEFLYRLAARFRKELH